MENVEVIAKAELAKANAEIETLQRHLHIAVEEKETDAHDHQSTTLEDES